MPILDDSPLRPWLQALRELVPGLDICDAHTHIGSNDPDGFSCTADELLAALEVAGARGLVFPMHEPDGYPPANDMVIAEAAQSAGRLRALCRLDPAADPLREAERCLKAGAVGIKLHPRAENFPLDTRELEPVFALADERRLPVLVHAGRGIPALGRHAVAVCERYPGLRLILAHAGICDLAWIWRAAHELPNLFFDTAWWSAADLLTLYTLAPPRSILFASDAPYGTPTFAAVMNLRYALQAGLSAEQVRAIFGRQLERLVAHEEPLDAGSAPGADGLSNDPLLDRVYSFLVSALGQMFNGVEPTESLQLAELACEVGDDAPQAPVCRVVLHLLGLRERARAAGADQGRPARFMPGIGMVVVAAGIVRTPDVPLPPVPGGDVGERTP